MDLLGNKTTLYHPVIMDTDHYLPKHREGTTQRVKSNVNYRFWVIMICQYLFISCNKRTTHVRDADGGGGFECVCGGDIWELCIFYSTLL